MVKICVGRHGQTGDNALDICTGQTRDPALTELGCAQAEDRAQALIQTGRKFVAGYASPLLRAKHTALIVSNIIGISEVVLVDDLKERFVGSAFETSGGVHMNTVFKEVAEEMLWLQSQPLEVTLDYHFKATPDAETIKEASLRFKRALREIASLHQDGEEVLVIAHSAVMGCTLIDMGKMEPAFNLNPFGSASIPNLGMMEFLVDGYDITYLG